MGCLFSQRLNLDFYPPPQVSRARPAAADVSAPLPRTVGYGVSSKPGLAVRARVPELYVSAF